MPPGKGRHGPPLRIRHFERNGVVHEEVSEVLRVVSPLTLEPRVPHERRYIYAAVADRRVPADPGYDIDPGTPAAGPAFACDADAVPETPPAQRLTRRQYENTLRDLIAWALASDTEAGKLMTAVAEPLKAVPEEGAPYLGAKTEGPAYGRIDQLVSDAHLSATYEIATELGQLLSKPPLVGAITTTRGGGISDRS